MSFLSLKGGYTGSSCQNVKLFEITCHGSIIECLTPLPVIVVVIGVVVDINDAVNIDAVVNVDAVVTIGVVVAIVVVASVVVETVVAAANKHIERRS